MSRPAVVVNSKLKADYFYFSAGPGCSFIMVSPALARQLFGIA